MKKLISLFYLSTFILLLSCGDKEEKDKCQDKSSVKKGQEFSNDPLDYEISKIPYKIEASKPNWVVPADNLPKGLKPQASNNNVEIIYHEGRLYMAWRTGPNHFASTDTEMYLVSSKDLGKTWDFEYKIALGTDVREPRFLSFKGELSFIFFEGGTDVTAFEPKQIWKIKRKELGQWSRKEIFRKEKEVPWDLKVRYGKAYLTTYIGNHYDFKSETSDIKVKFYSSEDGLDWKLVDGKDSVYEGGASEASFEFDKDGNLWAVTRNEDGDSSGFGSHVCFAKKESLGTWECSKKSDPKRYDSPEMFRHGQDIYLVARKGLKGAYDQMIEGKSLKDRRNKYLYDYSVKPKTTALYKIDQKEKKVVHLMDLPGTGDTAFPSIQRLGPHKFLMANYTSPLETPDLTWLQGQSSPKGTQIYLLELDFKANCPK